MSRSNRNSTDAITFSEFDLPRLKITVTGGRGFLGRHVVDLLVGMGASRGNILVPATAMFDLRTSNAAAEVTEGRDLVIHLAARVGGIGFNQQHPGELIYDNTTMGVNIIHQAHKNGVKKLVVAGTVCAYPKFTPVPFKEDDLWNGYPEETNAPYGIAKKHMLVMLQAYRQQYGLHGVFLLPANLYGPYDNFDLESSHVIPAMISKFVQARREKMASVKLWGDGSASREFLFVEDCARGLVAAAMKYDGPEPVNLGTHEEITIKSLAEMIKSITEYDGEILWDSSRPNGQPRRALDVQRARDAFGFEAKVSLREGLKRTIQWFQEQVAMSAS